MDFFIVRTRCFVSIERPFSTACLTLPLAFLYNKDEIGSVLEVFTLKFYPCELPKLPEDFKSLFYPEKRARTSLPWKYFFSFSLLVYLYFELHISGVY